MVYIANCFAPAAVKARKVPKFGLYFFWQMVAIFTFLSGLLGKLGVLMSFTCRATKLCVSAFRCKFFAAYLAFLGGGFSFAVIISSRAPSTAKITLLSIVVGEPNCYINVALFALFIYCRWGLHFVYLFLLRLTVRLFCDTLCRASEVCLLFGSMSSRFLEKVFCIFYTLYIVHCILVFGRKFFPFSEFWHPELDSNQQPSA